MPQTIVIVARSETDLAASLAIRLDVFVAEQGVPESLERDDRDADAIHLLAFLGESPVGTARLLPGADGAMKAGRVAVRRDFRDQGIGAALMRFAESRAAAEGYRSLVLHAQEPVVPFYVKLGYDVVGERFFEASIPHFKMTKEL